MFVKYILLSLKFILISFDIFILFQTQDQDYAAFKGHSVRKMEEGSDSEEGLHDSLDDNGIQDSGVGSSSEKAYRVIELIRLLHTGSLI